MLSLNYLVYNKGCENPIKVRGILRIIPKSGSYDYRNFRPLSRNIRKEYENNNLQFSSDLNFFVVEIRISLETCQEKYKLQQGKYVL